jgi:imidazolonepropionase
MARFRRIIWHISTRHAARALRLTDRSVTAAGKRGDLAVWLVAHPAELACRSDFNPLF